MSNITLKNQKGFTLIEMLLYISITMIIVLVISSFYGNTAKSQQKIKVSSNVQLQSIGLMEEVERIVRNSDNILSVTSDSVTLSQYNGSNVTIFLEEGNIKTLINGNQTTLNQNTLYVTGVLFELIEDQEVQSLSITIATNNNTASQRNEFHYSQSLTNNITIRK